jgi:hypothetical protein
MVDAKLNLRVCFSLAGGKGVNTGRREDFCPRAAHKKEFPFPEGKGLKGWGAVVSLTPEKTLNVTLFWSLANLSLIADRPKVLSITC